MNIQVRASHVIVITIAALALIFGVGAAGALAGAKYINGKQIKPNSIPANRLQKATVTEKQLKKGAITKRSMSARTVDQLDQTVVYVDQTFTAVDDPGGDQWVEANCPAGTQVVAGYVKPGFTAFADFSLSYVDETKNAFMIRISPTAADPSQVTIQTICLR